ncbi:hypothetical protein ACTXT7_010347 [Hymenolepis weldensis]
MNHLGKHAREDMSSGVLLMQWDVYIKGWDSMNRWNGSGRRRGEAEALQRSFKARLINLFRKLNKPLEGTRWLSTESLRISRSTQMN